MSYPCHWAVAVFASLSIHSTHSANSRCCRIFFISHFIARRTFYSQCSVWNVDLVRCATTPVIPIYILIHRIVILDFISLFFCCVADSIRMTILFNWTEYKPDRFSFHFFFRLFCLFRRSLAFHMFCSFDVCALCFPVVEATRVLSSIDKVNSLIFKLKVGFLWICQRRAREMWHRSVSRINHSFLRVRILCCVRRVCVCILRCVCHRRCWSVCLWCDSTCVHSMPYVECSVCAPCGITDIFYCKI